MQISTTTDVTDVMKMTVLDVQQAISCPLMIERLVKQNSSIVKLRQLSNLSSLLRILMTTNGMLVLTVSMDSCGTPHLMETLDPVSHVLRISLIARTVIITINVSNAWILSSLLITRQIASYLSKIVLLIQASIQAMDLNGFVLNVRKDITSTLRLKNVRNVRFKIVFDVCQRLNVLNVRKILTSHLMGLNVEETLSIVPLIQLLRIIQSHE